MTQSMRAVITEEATDVLLTGAVPNYDRFRLQLLTVGGQKFLMKSWAQVQPYFIFINVFIAVL